MYKQFSRKEALLHLISVFVAQYVSRVHGFKSFQSEAINMLTLYLLETIKRIAVGAKRITNMQGRTQSNCLHLLLSAEDDNMSLEKLLSFMVRRREQRLNFDQIFFEKLISKVFEDEDEGPFTKDQQYGNLRYVPPQNVFDSSNSLQVLQRSLPLSEVFDKPPEITYRATKDFISKEKKNVESLVAYTKREAKKAHGILIGELAAAGQESQVSSMELGQVTRKIKRFALIDNI